MESNDLTYSIKEPEERDPGALGIEIDKRSSVPIFVQIQDALKYLIATHKLTASDKLPSVRKFAKALEINPNTVDKAYITLEQEGFIRIEKGRGTFVNDGADHLPGEERIRQRDILIRDFINSAFRLGLTPQTLIEEITHRLPKDEK